MGLDFLSFLWENLKEVFIFVVGAVAFFLVITQSTGDEMFMRYYAKDLGLTMDSLSIAKGDVELSYDKFSQKHDFDYKFAANTVEVRESLPDEEGGHPWLWRRRYATIETGENEFPSPTILHFERTKERLLILQTAMYPPTCPPLPEPLRNVALKGVPSLEEAYPISTTDPYLVRVEITESEERNVSLIAENPLVAERARCALLQSLAPAPYTVDTYKGELPARHAMAIRISGNAIEIEAALRDWLSEVTR